MTLRWIDTNPSDNSTFCLCWQFILYTEYSTLLLDDLKDEIPNLIQSLGKFSTCTISIITFALQPQHKNIATIYILNTPRFNVAFCFAIRFLHGCREEVECGGKYTSQCVANRVEEINIKKTTIKIHYKNIR